MKFFVERMVFRKKRTMDEQNGSFREMKIDCFFNELKTDLKSFN